MQAEKKVKNLTGLFLLPFNKDGTMNHDMMPITRSHLASSCVENDDKLKKLKSWRAS